MGDNNIQRGRLPVAGQQMDHTARRRLSNSEDYSLTQNPSPNTHMSYDLNVHGVSPQHIQQTSPYTGRGQSPGSFSMSGMAGALPEYQSSVPGQVSHNDQQRLLAGTTSSASTYHSQPFHGQSPMSTPNYPGHPPQYTSAYPQGFHVQQSPQSHAGGPSPNHPSYPTGPYFPAQQQQYWYYPGQYVQNLQSQYGSGPWPQQLADIGVVGGRLPQNNFPSGLPSPYAYGSGGSYLRPGNLPEVTRRESSNSSTGSIPSTPRGPPRKPKQSGHALWAGNLPSGTIISDLKDHFSRDATKDIESVFLISKSNCAFVNYRTEAACAAAMTRFHDSRFHGVRLVCRLRRSNAVPPTTSPGIPTGPAALMPAASFHQTAFEAIQQNREMTSKHEASVEAQHANRHGKFNDKYFVMKSLTVEDMELSVRNCIWATQAHNEEGLNKAYETSENVYLIFSANKSGEYFGFARMASPITDETAAGLDWAPRGETVIDDPDIPRSIPTAPTGFAPKGRIIDDSARGTIFWEADLEDEDLAPIIDQETDDPVESHKADEQAEDVEEIIMTGEAQAFGKPFKIEWLSTNRLPFYRTRGLRNPWNANREVKIARDGTEIETSVGRRLVQMFQKANSADSSQGFPPAHGY